MNPLLNPLWLPFLCIAIAVGLLFHFVPINSWFAAWSAGAPIGLFALTSMRTRGVPPRIIIESLVTATKAGLKVTASEIEAHYLAGGRISSVIRALITADKADLTLSFKQAAAIDLAGRDIFEVVQTSLNPKVIDTAPVPAVTADGIQLITKAKVTVRTQLHQFIGSASEDTILARIAEGIITAIGTVKTHKKVLADPTLISRLVFDQRSDADTAFEILSIDIIDTDIGNDFGAKLEIDQAKAALKVAETRSEERRVIAAALEQETHVKSQDAKTQVILAGAEVANSIAAALRDGGALLMEYYRVQNNKANKNLPMSTPEGTNEPPAQ